MRLLWTLLKVAIGIVLVVPVCIIVLATVLGLFGALLGLAILALRIAVVGLIAYGAFRLIANLMRGPKARPEPKQLADAPKVDPYYEAAMRELDRDMGHAR
jgi:hypothetical protein